MLIGTKSAPQGERVPAIRRRSLLGAGLAGLAPLRAKAAAPARAASAAPLTLGALFPFSGPLSLLGDESFRGLDLAVDERNAAGGLLGRPVALARGDAAEAKTGAAEAQRLIGEAHVGAIFGTFASAVALAASAVADRAGVPYFELDALADSITARSFRLLFRSNVPGSACGVLAVDAVADLLAPHWELAPSRLPLVILHQDGIVGADIGAAAQKRAAERGLVQAERIAYPAAALDLGPIVQRLRGGGAEVVLHAGLLNDVLLFHRTMQQAGWRPRMVIGTGGGYALTDTAEALGPAFEGVMSVGFAPYRTSDVAAPGAAHVAAAYQRKYGAPPRSGHSLACFAGARMFFDAIERAGTLAPERLRPAVLATDVPSGASVGGFGVAFDEQGQNQRAEPYLAQWQNGALVTVAPAPAAVAQAAMTLGG
jgi:branched-chain amino acid transport system substrate-binding protein